MVELNKKQICPICKQMMKDRQKALYGEIPQDEYHEIVTSQEAIDALQSTQIRGRDFSKIMGRFATRLNLSSANTDEVIKRRLLVKNEVARQTLEALYGEISPTFSSSFSC